MHFCNDMGEMNESNCVDLCKLGDNIQLDIVPDVNENMANFLECFGEISYDLETTAKELKKVDTQLEGSQ